MIRLACLTCGLCLMLLSVTLLLARRQAAESSYFLALTTDSGVERRYPDGSGRRALLDVPAGSLAWSESGHWLAYVRDRDIFRVRTASREGEALTRTPAQELAPAWSSRGALAYIAARDGGIQLIWGEAGAVAGVRRDVASLDGAVWSPDGARLLYVRAYPGADGLVWVRPGEEALTLLTPDMRRVWNPGWSPDGRWISFVSDDSRVAYLHLVRPDGTGLQRLTPSHEITGAPAWSPDGRGIAFVLHTLAYTLYRMDVDNSGAANARRVTGSSAYLSAPRWSPDGRWLYFVRLSPARETAIYRVPADSETEADGAQFIAAGGGLAFSPLIDLGWRGGLSLLIGALILGLAAGLSWRRL